MAFRLKDKFVSRDGKIKLEDIFYSNGEIWLNVEHLLSLFNTKEKVESGIKIIEKTYKKNKKI